MYKPTKPSKKELMESSLKDLAPQVREQARKVLKQGEGEDRQS